MNMITTDAWVLHEGNPERPGPGTLVREAISFPAPGPDEVLIEPLLISWEGNCNHAVQRIPTDVCRQRGEPRVVLGNSGIVRVLQPGSAVTNLREGDICIPYGNVKPDRYGYLQNGGAFGFDAPNTIGLFARRTKMPAATLIPVPKKTRHSLEKWASFSIRYITAWANWRLALGTWRLQVTEQDQPLPYVWGWGGGTAFAELTLAQRHGASATMIASHPARFALAERSGLRWVDRRTFPDIAFDDDRASEPGYAERYKASEAAFMKIVKQATDGLGVSIFVDNIGGPLLRATLRALARQGVVATCGWREGMHLKVVRSIECIQRRQHVHTHYARMCEAQAAVEYGERTGWMPPIGADEPVWAYDDLGKLVDQFASGKVETYFPLVRVNQN